MLRGALITLGKQNDPQLRIDESLFLDFGLSDDCKP
jgi:hypothetical protein